MPGQYLETLTWREAADALARFPVLILPLGARLKEHGLHLPLNNDWLMAEYLARRVVEQFPVLALPTLQYGYYPAFVEYPGSVHLELNTFRGTLRDIARSFARHGAKKMYVLNTGISTLRGLEPVRQELALEGTTLEYTNLRTIIADVEAQVREQPAGSHADEIETSIMLYIRPDVVKPELAQRDIDLRRRGGGLTRQADAATGAYSPTGAFGDPTLATREKGRILTEALVERIVAFLLDFAQESYVPAPPRTEYLPDHRPAGK